MERILILGGGASGLAAAISAAETAPRGVKVTLLEANPRVGKKLLATGNGRCNLDNTAAALERYVTSEPQALSQMLGTMSNPLDWFHAHGLLTRADSEGRVYPYSNQAADVLNFLLRWLEKRMDGADNYDLVASDALTTTAGTYTHPKTPEDLLERNLETKGGRPHV